MSESRRVLKLTMLLLLGIIIIALLVLGFALGWWTRLGRVVGPWVVWMPLIILGVALLAVVMMSFTLLREFIQRYYTQRLFAQPRAHSPDAPADEADVFQRKLRE